MMIDDVVVVVVKTGATTPTPNTENTTTSSDHGNFPKQRAAESRVGDFVLFLGPAG